jgi:hypothetical protein
MNSVQGFGTKAFANYSELRSILPPSRANAQAILMVNDGQDRSSALDCYCVAAACLPLLDGL